MVLVPEIKLIRTDTTLDLSQKAEKVCSTQPLIVFQSIICWSHFGELVVVTTGSLRSQKNLQVKKKHQVKVSKKRACAPKKDQRLFFVKGKSKKTGWISTDRHKRGVSTAYNTCFIKSSTKDFSQVQIIGWKMVCSRKASYLYTMNWQDTKYSCK